jgi:hypothetical protein
METDWHETLTELQKPVILVSPKLHSMEQPEAKRMQREDSAEAEEFPFSEAPLSND